MEIYRMDYGNVGEGAILMKLNTCTQTEWGEVMLWFERILENKDLYNLRRIISQFNFFYFDENSHWILKCFKLLTSVFSVIRLHCLYMLQNVSVCWGWFKCLSRERESKTTKYIRFLEKCINNLFPLLINRCLLILVECRTHFDLKKSFRWKIKQINCILHRVL